ncbi:alpha/beta fold hydrolase [Novosphingobium album (ex Hu et al. 2023)]|uniref:Alpha/beta fold hydrolase n=1 Tax=Novosphingobium album (ex Hu et al. 2023) TaxID=2930093 RepID=A0ABT0AWG3_9SPHN|nr:alpha/beta fold hydrolase [Novosphingobium album (ex Hu et al. 2023)]MCJ2176958.1 alpha/beta fold hydrolase [Novosphingobium album (ex Hu et al. 2023)]
MPENEDIARRIELEIDRALKRNIRGLDFLIADREPVGTMPKSAIYRSGTAVLYRYEPVLDEVYRKPLLIVSPPSNRGYIFDLAPGQSFVEYMLRRGYDIYNLDWNPPRRDEAELGLSDYVNRFLPESLAAIAGITGEKGISLAGYCMGGTLAVMHAALHPKAIRNLIAFATPLDFNFMKLFQSWADKRYFDVELLVSKLGIIPADVMLGAFDLSRPANRTAGRMTLWNNMWNDDFVKSYRMFDRWAAETLPLPGAYFRELITQLMWENALANGTMEIAGRRVDLSRITCPILNIVAQHDHIVSHEATRPLMEMTGSKQRHEIVSKGGHVSLVAGPAAVKRLWPLIDEWLGEKST